MKANVKLLKKQRRITDEFKKGIVKDFESGQLSIAQLSSLYGVHSSMIYRWIYKFSNFNAQGVRIIEMKMSSTEKIKELEKKVKELERIVGNKQIMIDFLEKMIELTKEELDIDIKKNYNTLRSGGSKPTESK